MEFNLITEAKRPLLSRSEYLLKLKYDGATPKGTDVKKNVANFLKAKEELTIVRKIGQNFGVGTADVNVYVYENIESLKRFSEIKKKKVLKAKRDEELKKHNEAKAAAAKPAEPAQPAPAQ